MQSDVVPEVLRMRISFSRLPENERMGWKSSPESFLILVLLSGEVHYSTPVP
jgi:hypothetical protein